MSSQGWPHTVVNAILGPGAENECHCASPTGKVGAVQAACKKIVSVRKRDLLDSHFVRRWSRTWLIDGALGATAEQGEDERHARSSCRF
jgi:hypothetical protein